MLESLETTTEGLMHLSAKRPFLRDQIPSIETWVDYYGTITQGKVFIGIKNKTIYHNIIDFINIKIKKIKKN